MPTLVGFFMGEGVGEKPRTGSVKTRSVLDVAQRRNGPKAEAANSEAL
jgi:hypothetical protein